MNSVEPSVNSALSDTARDRRYGPVDTDLLFTEFALQLRLTGGKTWHGLAPYFGGGIGLAFDARSAGDTTDSGYQFGTKLTFSGATGVRWHATRPVGCVAPKQFRDVAQAVLGQVLLEGLQQLRRLDSRRGAVGLHQRRDVGSQKPRPCRPLM